MPRTVLKAARANEYVLVAAPVLTKTPGQFDLLPIPADMYERYLGIQLVDVGVPPAPDTQGLAAIIGRVGSIKSTFAKALDVQVNCYVWLISMQPMLDVDVSQLNWDRLYWVRDPNSTEGNG